MTEHLGLALIAISAWFAVPPAYALELPKELSTVWLEMSISSFAATHPNAKYISIDWVGPVEPAKLTKGFAHITDSFAKDSDYTGAAYGFRDGRLVTIEIGRSVPSGQEHESRKRAIQESVARWGPDFKKIVLGDPGMVHQRLAGLVWIVDGAEVMLTLPRERTKKDTSPMKLGVKFRTRDMWKNYPMIGPPMDSVTREALFKSNDIP